MAEEKELNILRDTIAEEIARFESESAKPHPDIDVVWSFSGPGTLLSPLKEYEEPWMAWMEAHRLQRAILLVYEVTALRLGKPVQKVSRHDVEESGPILFYNGIPMEMEVFRELASLEHFPIPQPKVITVQGVIRPETETRVEIGNTRDQVLSYPPEIFEDPIPRTVACVSSAAHLPRVLRYIDMIRPFQPDTGVLCFPIHSDPTWAAIDAVRETQRILEYFHKGHLSANPYPADLGLI